MNKLQLLEDIGLPLSELLNWQDYRLMPTLDEQIWAANRLSFTTKDPKLNRQSRQLFKKSWRTGVIKRELE